MKTFYTSDPHHGHKNVIKYGKRPFLVAGETYENYGFKSVENMTEGLIERWNSRVSKEDQIFVLGDFAFHNVHGVKPILQRLNGVKILIAGNHDSRQVKRLPEWASVHDYMEIYDGNHFIVMSHYPFAVWNKSHHGSLNLHGHSHGSFRGSSQQQDVGVDCWDYYPVTLEEILARMKGSEPFSNKDRHGKAK